MHVVCVPIYIDVYIYIVYTYLRTSAYHTYANGVCIYLYAVCINGVCICMCTLTYVYLHVFAKEKDTNHG